MQSFQVPGRHPAEADAGGAQLRPDDFLVHRASGLETICLCPFLFVPDGTKLHATVGELASRDSGGFRPTGTDC
jgi:hypothetical protein